MVMGRLSIYLPDELEARAKALQPDTPTSQVVRAALERYIGTTEEPAYAQAPADIDELVAAGVAHFGALAVAEYQSGYRSALKRLPDLNWFALAEYAAGGFQLEKWLGGWRDNISFEINQGHSLDSVTPDWLSKVAKDVGELADPIGFEGSNHRHPQPWERGYADGLRVAYEAAVSAGVMTAAPSALPVIGSKPDEGDDAADSDQEDADTP